MECSFGSVDVSQLRLVTFDLDGILAPSKSPIVPTMARSLERLLSRLSVGVMSSGLLSQFQTQLLSSLKLGEVAGNLHLLPTCGTQYYCLDNDGQPQALYVETPSNAQRAAAVRILEAAARELRLWEADPWGEVIEDRGAQITFSALGQRAPLEAETAWGPDGSKRRALVVLVQRQLPDLPMQVGGTTSVDVTIQGIDKTYGIRVLLAQMGLQASQALFVGDQLVPEGNDYPVASTGVTCQAVVGWEETLSRIESLLMDT